MLKVKFLMGPVECNDRNIPAYSRNFLHELSESMGMEIQCAEMAEIRNEDLQVYFIASGGAEQGFKEAYIQTAEPFVLLTAPAYNSLAAAMEIMGFLKEHNVRGEILHGSIEYIANRLRVLRQAASAKKALCSMRLGCFGPPGGLIASDANFYSVKKISGMEMMMFDLGEVISEYHRGGFEQNSYVSELEQKDFNIDEIKKALRLYGALKRLTDKYHLDGVTVKCFDLLNLIHTTGCLALAILNAEGIPAACEGDQKSLISMAILRALTGQSGFMANPSCLDPERKEIIFAHCTLPIDMSDTYELTTHFESGIGVAVTSDMVTQPMTIFKCNDSLNQYYAGKAELLEMMHRENLCRSQMRLYLPEGTEYFLKAPISNHHIICKGDWKAVIDEYFRQI